MPTTQLKPRPSINGNGHDPHANGLPHRENLLDSALAVVDTADGLEEPNSLADLRRENAQLQETLDQARDRLKQAEKNAQHWKVREQEYEGLLEEKSEVIRTLHAQLEAGGGTGATPKRAPREVELIGLQQELEAEREQLRQDEEALMAEMRNMEITMSRERAELARQRSELQRLQNELKHELEVASRDAALREKLAPLYRLQDELQRRKSGESGLPLRNAAPQPAAAPAPAATPSDEPIQKRSGFLRRMFKGG